MDSVSQFNQILGWIAGVHTLNPFILPGSILNSGINLH